MIFLNLKIAKKCDIIYNMIYKERGGMHMNIYPWYIFSTVAEQKSFIKAASILNISQSAVSHAIAKLENECGYSLFIRNRNSIELTANGRKEICA